MPFTGPRGTHFLRVLILWNTALYTVCLLFGCYAWIEQGHTELQTPILVSLGTLQTLVAGTVTYTLRREQGNLTEHDSAG